MALPPPTRPPVASHGHHMSGTFGQIPLVDAQNRFDSPLSSCPSTPPELRSSPTAVADAFSPSSAVSASSSTRGFVEFPHPESFPSYAEWPFILPQAASSSGQPQASAPAVHTGAECGNTIATPNEISDVSRRSQPQSSVRRLRLLLGPPTVEADVEITPSTTPLQEDSGFYNAGEITGARRVSKEASGVKSMFPKILENLKNRNAEGMPEQYAVEQSFWVHPKSTFFTRKPELTFFCWDPLSLVDTIACPGVPGSDCGNNLRRDGFSRHAREVLDTNDEALFYVIGGRYSCISNHRNLAWSANILKNIPESLRSIFPAVWDETGSKLYARSKLLPCSLETRDGGDMSPKRSPENITGSPAMPGALSSPIHRLPSPSPAEGPLIVHASPLRLSATQPTRRSLKRKLRYDPLPMSRKEPLDSTRTLILQLRPSKTSVCLKCNRLKCKGWRNPAYCGQPKEPKQTEEIKAAKAIATKAGATSRPKSNITMQTRPPKRRRTATELAVLTAAKFQPSAATASGP